MNRSREAFNNAWDNAGGREFDSSYEEKDDGVPAESFYVSQRPIALTHLILQIQYLV